MKFGKEFPSHSFEIGIAEPNMAGIADGLASCGKIFFASSFAVFLCDKSHGQMHMAVA
jgi:transketolase